MPESQEHRALSFSVQGSFITRLAREKLYYNNNLTGALKLIMACTETDQLSEDTRTGIALAILDGRKEIVGVYPGDTYGVVDVPENQRPKQTLETYVTSLQKKLEDLQHENKLLGDKLVCIAEEVPEYMSRDIDATWRHSYWDKNDKSDGADTIFGTTPARSMDTDSILGSALVSSYLARMTNPCDDPDYGWLFADGHFEPVDFGDHAGWVYEWLQKHEPDWFTKLPDYTPERDRASLYFSDAGDYLQRVHHACLLHNPSMGIAILTASGDLTKAQKDFMFDYYTKRGMTDKANALFNDSTLSDRSY